MSKDETSRVRGGDVRWADAEAAVPLVEAVAAGLAVGVAAGSPAAGVCFGAVVAMVLAGTGRYRPRMQRRLVGDAMGLVAATAIAALILPRHWLVASAPPSLFLAVVALLALVGAGIVFHLAVAPFVAGRGARPTLVVGAGHVGVMLAEELSSRRGYGLLPVGFVDDCGTDSDLPLPLVGAVNDLSRRVSELAIRDVIIAFGVSREVDLVDVLRQCESTDVRMWHVPRLFELAVPFGAEQIRGVPILPLRRSRLWARHRIAKRVLDLTISSTMLVILAPIMMAIALAVRLSSVGPILFRQERVGQHGKHIMLLKFRTMRVNDDSATRWSVLDDDRVTPVGRLLRQTSLDELPQLLNVFRGDLALVGPRPERPHFVEKFSGVVPRYDGRLRMPMGMTGLAQVSGLRGDTSISERVFLDNQYIDSWSLWGDVVILFQTLRTIIRQPEGAAADRDGGFGPLRLAARGAHHDGRLAIHHTESGSPSVGSDLAPPVDQAPVELTPVGGVAVAGLVTTQ